MPALKPKPFGDDEVSFIYLLFRLFFKSGAKLFVQEGMSGCLVITSNCHTRIHYRSMFWGL